MGESYAAMGSPALVAGERLSPRGERETGVGGSPRRANRLVQVLRAVYLVLAWIFAAGVLVQAYLAGLGIFAAGPWLEVHSGLGWTLALVAIGLLVLVFASRQPRQIVLLNLLLFVLLFVQVGV